MYTQHVNFIAHILCWHFWVYEANFMFDIVFESCLQRHRGDTLQQSGCFSPQQALLASCNLLIAPDHRSFPKRLPWLLTFRHLLPDSLMLHPHVSVAYRKFSFPFNAHSLQLAVQRITGGNDCWSWSHNAQSSCSRCCFLSRWEFLNIFNTALE